MNVSDMSIVEAIDVMKELIEDWPKDITVRQMEAIEVVTQTAFDFLHTDVDGENS